MTVQDEEGSMNVIVRVAEGVSDEAAEEELEAIRNSVITKESDREWNPVLRNNFV